MSARQNPAPAETASTRVDPPTSGEVGPPAAGRRAGSEAPASPEAATSPEAAASPDAAVDPSARVGAAGAALWFVGSVLFFIWVIQPLRRPVLAAVFLLYIVLLAVAINVRAGESPWAVGFRVDNLRQAARLTAPPTLLLALLILLTAVVFHGHVRTRSLLIGLVAYPLWGLTQQYALQGVVFRRVRRAGAGAWAAPLAAALFALVHAPNPGLMLMTFVGAWLWCELYRRSPNLFVLAVSHGLLATLLLGLLPWRITGGMRIGPGYLHFHARHRVQYAARAPAARRPPPPRPPASDAGTRARAGR